VFWGTKTEENILATIPKEKQHVLPLFLPYAIPRYLDEQQYWFGKSEARALPCQGEEVYERALIAEGIGRHECPLQREWGGFVLIGGLIATMSGKYIIPPAPAAIDWAAQMEFYTWDVLWDASEKYGLKLSSHFLGSMLRGFLPRRHDSAGMRPWYASNFSERWRTFRYANDDLLAKFGSIRFDILRQGKEDLETLSSDEMRDTKRVSAHIPAMLQIATHCIQDRQYPA